MRSSTYLAPVRERYEELRPDQTTLEAALAQGAEKARAIAADTLADVRDAMGVGAAAVAPSSSASKLTSVPVADLDLELDVFAGPFDLLMAVVLREGVNLAEVELGEVVVAYIEHLEEQGELDLEAATEFLVLIAALLELKSRLLLPQEEADEEALEPEEAAEELLARMLEYRRYRDAGAHLAELFADGRRFLYRRAPLPPELRRISLEAARPVYVGRSARAGDRRAPADAAGSRHLPHPADRLARAPARRPAGAARGRGESWTSTRQFGTEDRLTQAVTIFALLEMHKRGEATWEQKDLFGPITISVPEAGREEEVA